MSMNKVSKEDLDAAVDEYAKLLKSGVYGYGCPFTLYICHERPDLMWVTPPPKENGMKGLPVLCHRCK